MIAERVAAGVARRIEDFANAGRHVWNGSDSEAIHDVRVAARRLIATLRSWESLLDEDGRRLALRALKRVRRRLGVTRELEVHIALLESRLRQHGELTHAAAAVLLVRMKDRLERRHARAAKRLRPKRLKRMVSTLEAAVAPLRDRIVADASALEQARGHERRLGVAAREALRSARKQTDDPTLHQARIAIKKWRYALEAIEEAAPGTLPNPVAELRELQAVLGNAHDATTMSEVLERSARRLEAEHDHVALQPLIDTLEAERSRAVEDFQRLAEALLARPDLTSVPAPTAPEPSWPSDEKERMARWLTGRR